MAELTEEEIVAATLFNDDDDVRTALAWYDAKTLLRVKGRPNERGLPTSVYHNARGVLCVIIKDGNDRYAGYRFERLEEALG